MRQRPELYLGRRSITAMRDYLGGFQSAMYVFGIKNSSEKLLPLDFWFFNEYVANHFNWYESTAGWNNIILQENDFDEEKSLWVFYELFDGFRALSIENYCHTVLREENINYHYENEYAPKRGDGIKTEPLYINPKEAYMIRLTDSTGFLWMVNTDLHHRLWQKIFKTRNEIEMFSKQCFGTIMDWKHIETDNIEFHTKADFN